jgi:hypothetical protein
MERAGQSVTKYAKGVGNIYTLWSFAALAGELPTAAELSARYVAFMTKVETLAGQKDLENFLRDQRPGRYTNALAYLNNSRGASTDAGPRKERLAALSAALIA